MPSHSEIEALAHEKWSLAGEPQGNDGSYFWHLAEQELKEQEAKVKTRRAASKAPATKVAAKQTPSPSKTTQRSRPIKKR